MIVRLTKTNRIWGSLRSSNHIGLALELVEHGLPLSRGRCGLSLGRTHLVRGRVGVRVNDLDLVLGIRG